MAKLTITYLDTRTVEVELPEKMIADWENGETFLDEIVYEIGKTNQCPMLDDGYNIYAGLITSVESDHVMADGLDGLKINGESI